MKTSVTMMYGLGETDADRIEHLFRVREVQRRTGGFTAFICWPLQPEGTPGMSHYAEDRRGDLPAHPRHGRIVLDNVPNLQSSWVTMGHKVGQVALRFGANDYGSLMMEENVVSAAGTTYRTTIGEIERLIRDAGYEPRRRRQDYSVMRTSRWRACDGARSAGMTATSASVRLATASSRAARSISAASAHSRHAPQGLAGHSDADAVAHALTDAILGAAGAGDIGRLFPDTDPRWKDADSLELLRAAHELRARRAASRSAQADLTVITEQPKLGAAPRRPWPRALAGAARRRAPATINVKAKTNEGMGFIGRGEGLAVIAVPTLEAR